MPIASASTTIETEADMTITDSNGNLVCACHQPIPRLLNGYEADRISWLTKHRNRYAPKSYREGRYTLVAFLYHLITINWR